MTSEARSGAAAGAGTWVEVGGIADLPEDRAVAVADGTVLVIRHGDEVTAWRNRCGHRDLSLHGGLVADGVVTCPHHLWRYRTTDGTCLAGGRDEALVPVAVVVDEGRVRVHPPPPPPSLVELLRAHARDAIASTAAPLPPTPLPPTSATDWTPSMPDVRQSTPRPALVWDMGGILYRYFTEVLRDMAAAGDWPDLVLGPTVGSDPDYERMTVGEIDEHVYLAIVRARLADAGIDVDPVTAIDWPTQERAVAWQLVAAAGAEHRPQGLLTNDASKWLGEDWWETWSGAGHFAHLIDVRHVGVRKPEPEPYLAAAAALGLQPRECLFIDDMVVNCKGAEAVGMASHHVDIRHPDDDLRALADRLGLVLA